MPSLSDPPHPRKEVVNISSFPFLGTGRVLFEIFPVVGEAEPHNTVIFREVEAQ